MSPLAPGVSSGNVLRSHVQPGFGVKWPLGERLDAALIFDRPFGADTRYPDGTGYPLAGSSATIDSEALTGVLRYRAEGGFGVHAGVRLQRLSGRAQVLSGPLDYRLSAQQDTAVGYLVGVSWERPEIAARVALTYNSAIRHRFAAVESSSILGLVDQATRFSTSTPESVNLEFQTGVAPDTLLLGSVRWVRWSQFRIAPPVYANTLTAIGSPFTSLVSYASDTITYSLGVGRRFNETWSGAVTLVHEPRHRDLTTNLGPVDGRTGIGLAATWTEGAVSLTAGVQYFRVGNATTIPTTSGSFRNNSAVAGGLRVAVRF